MLASISLQRLGAHRHSTAVSPGNRHRQQQSLSSVQASCDTRDPAAGPPGGTGPARPKWGAPGLLGSLGATARRATLCAGSAALLLVIATSFVVVASDRLHLSQMVIQLALCCAKAVRSLYRTALNSQTTSMPVCVGALYGDRLSEKR